MTTAYPWNAGEVPAFPDAESALLYALVPLEPDVRFVTVMPGTLNGNIIARVHRISGANRNIGVDDPIVDIDVFGPKAETGSVSNAARDIQADVLSLMGKVVPNGVIQHVTTVVGPRQLPEANPDIVRYSASYELHIHP
jgi:hypothetical protein